jgi:phosphatidylserine/phosphatidylglycerophosphate/cardiolipin synthase-like enzyme
MIFSVFLISCVKNAQASNKSNTSTEKSQTENQIETYFTKKDGNLDKILIKEINAAEKTLDVAIYLFTKENIAEAILEAKKRGVDVKVITDKQESQSKVQKAILDKLKANNIEVKINSHTGLMHLKLSIIDDKTTLCGSYNYTVNATKENDENLIIMRMPNIVSQYSAEFNNMWNDTANYSNY